MSKAGTKASSKSTGKAGSGRAKPTPEESKAQKKARALKVMELMLPLELGKLQHPSAPLGDFPEHRQSL